MGSWNGTCGITNLPIDVGEDIVAFVCKPNRFEQRPCYSTTLAQPIFYPVVGKYNDYGGIENIVKSKSSDLLLTYLNNKYRQDYEDIEECLRAVADDSLDDLYLFMVKKELYDELIEEIGARIPYKNDVCMTDLFKSLFLKIQILMDEPNNELSEFEKTLNEEELETSNKYKYLMHTMKIDTALNDFSRDLATILKYTVNKNILLINESVQYCLFEYAMSGLRKSYYPTSGSGSQCDERYLHKLVGKFMVGEEAKKAKSYYENSQDDSFISGDEELKKWYNTTSSYPTRETYFWR